MKTHIYERLLWAAMAGEVKKTGPVDGHTGPVPPLTSGGGWTAQHLRRLGRHFRKLPRSWSKQMEWKEGKCEFFQKAVESDSVHTAPAE